MAEIITIDGPSSSGKSSIGLLFAQKINFQFIDTGAIYRAGCLLAIENHIQLSDTLAITQIFTNLNIEFQTHKNKIIIFVDGKDVTSKLHTPDVTKIVPIIGAVSSVRDAAKRIQYQAALQQDTVMAGRDIGSEIFPDSKLKFFITASAQVRAERRYKQHVKNGEQVTYEQILEDTQKRDQLDTNRLASPMRIPKDAIVIDTSNINITESVALLMKYFNQVFFRNISS